LQVTGEEVAITLSDACFVKVTQEIAVKEIYRVPSFSP
jgi:hypothetical protein